MGQVGQTSLAVVPNMRSFRSKVNAESKASARSAGRSMENEFGRSGIRAGRTMSEGFRSGSKNSEAALKDLTRANAQATNAWSSANRNHMNSLGQVRVAQAKLGDAISKYGEDSTQAIAAQERLATAQRRAEVTAAKLSAAQDRLAESARALADAQAGIGNKGGSVWSKMAKDLEPVTQRMTALRDRLVETFNTSRLGQGLTKVWDGFTAKTAQAALATYNFGDRAIGRVISSARGMGESLAGSFKGFLAQHPLVNTAVTKVAAGFRSVGATVAGAGQVFGAFGRAAGTAAAAVGRALGPGLSATWSGLTSMIGQTANAFTSVLGGAAVVAGGMIAGAMTKAMVGGFSRLSNIENAQAKMKGLGFAAGDIEQAMAGASDAVDGTAYSLDEMASAASVAMAAGLKPGKQLNAYMATLKNSSSAAGVSLGEMGQILNKTLTSGKASTMEINQIADRGLPIWTKLQEAYGVTADELRDMVSRGEVDTEKFMQVMNDMTGSVADEMGGTTSAAIKNFGSALSKLGADMLQGLYPVIGPLFNALKTGVQMLQKIGAPAFEAFGAAFAPLAEKLQAFSDGWTVAKDKIAEGMAPIEAIKGVFESVGVSLDGPLEAFKRIGMVWDSLGAAVIPVVGGIVGALGPLLARLPLVGGAFSGITGPVGIFVGVLIAAWQQSESFRNAVAAVFDSLMQAVQPVLAALGPLLATLGEAFGVVAGVIGDVLGAALMAIVPLFEPLGLILATLVEALTPILALIGPIAEMIGGILVTALTAVTPLFEFVGEILTMLAPIITMVGETLGMLLAALMPLLPVFTQLIGAILPPLISLFTTILGPIMQLAGIILSSLMPVIQALITILQGLINFVSGVFSGNWSQAWNGIKQVFQGFVDGISGMIGGLGKIIGGIKDTVFDVLGGIGSWLVDSGSALIQGFIDGIMGMIGAVGDAVAGVVDWARGFFPNSPAKRGPLSGSGWRNLKRSGVAYMEQWKDGIEEGAKGLDLGSLTSESSARISTMFGSGPDGSGGLAGAVADAIASLLGGGPLAFNLFDHDGKLITTMRGVVDGALRPARAGNVKATLGVRR